MAHVLHFYLHHAAYRGYVWDSSLACALIQPVMLLISSLCPFREQEFNAAKCLKEPNIAIGISCGVIGKEELSFIISRVCISPCFLRILEKAAGTRTLCILFWFW